MPRIEPGTEVTWASQAQGSWQVKSGTVVAFVPRGSNGLKLVREEWRGYRSRIKFQATSLVDRYLVSVPDRRGRPNYYAPHAAALERQTQRIQTS